MRAESTELSLTSTSTSTSTPTQPIEQLEPGAAPALAPDEKQNSQSGGEEGEPSLFDHQARYTADLIDVWAKDSKNIGRAIRDDKPKLFKLLFNHSLSEPFRAPIEMTDFLKQAVAEGGVKAADEIVTELFKWKAMSDDTILRHWAWGGGRPPSQLKLSPEQLVLGQRLITQAMEQKTLNKKQQQFWLSTAQNQNWKPVINLFLEKQVIVDDEVLCCWVYGRPRADFPYGWGGIRLLELPRVELALGLLTRAMEQGTLSSRQQQYWLTFAVLHNWVAGVRFLLDKGVKFREDPDSSWADLRHGTREHPYYKAIRAGACDTLQILLEEKQVNLDNFLHSQELKPTAAMRPLQMAAISAAIEKKEGPHEKIIRLLVRYVKVDQLYERERSKDDYMGYKKSQEVDTILHVLVQRYELPNSDSKSNLRGALIKDLIFELLPRINPQMLLPMQVRDGASPLSPCQFAIDNSAEIKQSEYIPVLATLELLARLWVISKDTRVIKEPKNRLAIQAFIRYLWEPPGKRVSLETHYPDGTEQKSYSLFSTKPSVSAFDRRLGNSELANCVALYVAFQKKMGDLPSLLSLSYEYDCSAVPFLQELATFAGGVEALSKPESVGPADVKTEHGSGSMQPAVPPPSAPAEGDGPPLGIVSAPVSPPFNPEGETAGADGDSESPSTGVSASPPPAVNPVAGAQASDDAFVAARVGDSHWPTPGDADKDAKGHPVSSSNADSFPSQVSAPQEEGEGVAQESVEDSQPQSVSKKELSPQQQIKESMAELSAAYTMLNALTAQFSQPVVPGESVLGELVSPHQLLSGVQALITRAQQLQTVVMTLSGSFSLSLSVDSVAEPGLIPPVSFKPPVVDDPKDSQPVVPRVVAEPPVVAAATRPSADRVEGAGPSLKGEPAAVLSLTAQLVAERTSPLYGGGAQGSAVATRARSANADQADQPVTPAAVVVPLTSSPDKPAPRI